MKKAGTKPTPASAPGEETGAQGTSLLHEPTYVFEADDVRVLPVPQENLDLFRGVSLTLIDDLEQAEHVT